jgi:hypothetical protein
MEALEEQQTRGRAGRPSETSIDRLRKGGLKKSRIEDEQEDIGRD